jgi:GAF domain-containing protein
MPSERVDALIDELRAALRTGHSRAERARAFADIVRRAGDFRWVGLYEVTEDSIVAIAWTGRVSPAFPSFPRTAGLNGAAVAAGTTVIANDVARDPRYLTAFPTTGAEMIVPIRVAGAVAGTLDIESPRAGDFGPDEQALAERCAAVAAMLWS